MDMEMSDTFGHDQDHQFGDPNFQVDRPFASLVVSSAYPSSNSIYSDPDPGPGYKCRPRF